MSFTQDELQALNAIVDQKMRWLLSELERSFDQRMQSLRQEFEQYQQRMAESMERSFVAQLLAFEQLISRRFSAPNTGELPPLPAMYTDLPQTCFESIEVQTEIPWEDLIDLLNKALNERFVTFNTSLQARLRDMEHEVSLQIQLLHDDLRREQLMASASGQGQATAPTEAGMRATAPTEAGMGVTTHMEAGRQVTVPTEAGVQDILTSINQLERIVESMQVAIAANSALFSHRLYYHQNLPIERAHPSSSVSPAKNDHSIEKDAKLSPSSPEGIDE